LALIVAQKKLHFWEAVKNSDISESVAYFLRTTSDIISKSENLTKLSEDWLVFLDKHFRKAKAGEGAVEQMAKEAKDYLKNNPANKRESTFCRGSDSLTIFGAACVFWYVFTKRVP
jgi:hypothetical protein